MLVVTLANRVRSRSGSPFVNHTHVFDMFGANSKAVKQTTVDHNEVLDAIEITYDESHPDFIAACEIGKTAAKLWALKLKQDFPNDGFRVYYTEFDSPIVRFHKVRSDEPLWRTDEAISQGIQLDLRNALVFDTSWFEISVSGTIQ